MPKVIDFGVAKATGQQLDRADAVHRARPVVGTLEYMTPEQAELNSSDIDTRSDIYSLGVLLYELLTGTTPLDRTAAREGGLCRNAADDPRGGAAQAEHAADRESKDSLASISAQRQTEPAKLTKLVRGELDWIVMKALEKDRNRRYETANGLAMDVQRYLADEPVQACPPSAGYRFRKFVRRNKVSVLAAAIVFLALVAGTIGTALGLMEARRQQRKALEAAMLEKEARIAEAAQRQRAVDALARVTAEQQKTERPLTVATRARTQTRVALNTMTDDVIQRLLAKQPILGDEEKAFLQKVIGFYEAFATERGDSAEARSVAADGQFRIAEVRAFLGERNAAVEGFVKASHLWEKLAADFPVSHTIATTGRSAASTSGMSWLSSVRGQMRRKSIGRPWRS